MSPRTSALVRRLALPGTAILATLLVSGCQDTTKAAAPSISASPSATATASATPSPTPTPTATSTPTAVPTPTTPTPSATTPKPAAPPRTTAPQRTHTPRQSAPKTSAPKTHAPKPPQRTQAPAGGAILSPSGKHYRAGQFCPKRLRGVSTVDDSGTRISCYAAPGDRLRWH
ncbi:hypothetical protein ACIO3O_33130 [Streptomyces sp. NPDC087440]|uniref:hypothetical protein n=1 Tax=Streptomyces sp. NPDC087440 TaxID=3365790 RepID=UPI0037FBC7B2